MDDFEGLYVIRNTEADPLSYGVVCNKENADQIVAHLYLLDEHKEIFDSGYEAVAVPFFNDAQTAIQYINETEEDD